jgi:hypothetical protein
VARLQHSDVEEESDLQVKKPALLCKEALVAGGPEDVMILLLGGVQKHVIGAARLSADIATVERIGCPAHVADTRHLHDIAGVNDVAHHGPRLAIIATVQPGHDHRDVETAKKVQKGRQVLNKLNLLNEDDLGLLLTDQLFSLLQRLERYSRKRDASATVLECAALVQNTRHKSQVSQLLSAHPLNTQAEQAGFGRGDRTPEQSTTGLTWNNVEELHVLSEIKGIPFDVLFLKLFRSEGALVFFKYIRDGIGLIAGCHGAGLRFAGLPCQLDEQL